MVESINLVIPHVGKDIQIDRWMKHAKDASNWEQTVKNMVLRFNPSTRSMNVGDGDDEVVEDARNEPPIQTPL